MSGGASTIAAIVLTLNEERNLPDCLDSLAWCDEVWVVDSLSTDGTLEVARRQGARVLQHPFENFSTQHNWALDNIGSPCDWVIKVDADERIPEPLANEIRQRLAQDGQRYAGYYIPRLQFFWGRWLKHGEAWPNYNLRLFRRHLGRYSNREVHEAPILRGETARLSQPMLHYSTETMTEAIARLNRYTSLDALRMHRTGQELYTPESGSYSRKNQLLKAVFGWLPFKPLAKFGHDYVIKQGFRDGYQGFAWAVLQGFYVWVAYFKLWELRQQSEVPNDDVGRRSRSPGQR